MWRGKTTICETQSFSTADFDCPVLWVDQRAAVHPTHAEELERIDVLYVAQNEARKEGHEGKEWKSKEEKGELLKEKKKHTQEKKKWPYKRQGEYFEVVKETVETREAEDEL